MRAFRRLLKYVKPHIAWALASVAGMIGVAVASVFLVFLLSPVLDEVLGGRREQVVEVAEEEGGAAAGRRGRDGRAAGRRTSRTGAWRKRGVQVLDQTGNRRGCLVGWRRQCPRPG